MITFEGPQCMWTNPSQKSRQGSDPPFRQCLDFGNFWSGTPSHNSKVFGNKYLRLMYNVHHFHEICSMSCCISCSGRCRARRSEGESWAEDGGSNKQFLGIYHASNNLESTSWIHTIIYHASKDMIYSVCFSDLCEVILNFSQVRKMKKELKKDLGVDKCKQQ